MNDLIDTWNSNGHCQQGSAEGAGNVGCGFLRSWLEWDFWQLRETTKSWFFTPNRETNSRQAAF